MNGNPYAILSLLFSSHESSVLIRYTPLIDTGTKLAVVNMCLRRLLSHHAGVGSNCLYVSLASGRVLNMDGSETPRMLDPISGSVTIGAIFAGKKKRSSPCHDYYYCPSLNSYVDQEIFLSYVK